MSPSTCASATATASTCTTECVSWSRMGGSAPSPAGGSMTTAADPRAAELLERFALKAFVESCLLLQEGVASMKDIDLGLMAGANITPPPLQRADQVGLDE